jgi:AraC-like DNA-binding protein
MKKNIISSIQHLKINLQPEHSFSARHDVVPFFFNKLHYHPEMELVYIIKGTGKQFIGDSIHYFKSGDMILVGENMPHLWRSDEKYFSKRTASACEAYVIHFTQNCFGETFFQLPENKNLLALIKKAKQGIRISGNTRTAIIQMMQELLNAASTKRVMLLINILDLIATSKNIKTICRQDAYLNFSDSDSERINAICQYIMQHFNQKLTLKEIAAVAHLSPNSFCRYFKSRIKKSFSNFLIEIRIGHACKLLAETDMPVADICFDCGYNTLSNFNKHFKSITKKSPLAYRALISGC